MGAKTLLARATTGRAVLARVLERAVAPGGPAPDRAAPSATLDDLVAYVARHLERLRVPGGSLAIVEGDQLLHLSGFGRARPGGEAPSPQTPFILGSTTKSFTALAVMQLVEGGRIELDAPVRRYLPWFRVADPEASAHMTVRHLLHQTSGLPQVPGACNLADLDQSPGARERQARALATLVLKRPVGAAWEYSNLNYTLLGLIVEAATGDSYEAYIRRHIFAPLEMRHSYATRAEAEQHGLAVGHRYWFAAPIAVPDLPVPRGSVPAGYLIASAEDLAQYLIAHLNEGRYRDARILSPAGIAALHHPAAPVEIMGRSAGAYGMGWFIEDRDRRRILWHDGIVPDFYAYMALVPEHKKGVVLLINVGHMLMSFTALREVGVGLGTLLAGHQPPPMRTGAIPWALRGLLLIPLLQLVGVAASVRRARRRRRDPLSRPVRGRAGLRSLLALLPDLAVALPLLVVLRTGTLRLVLLFMPDGAWVALIGGTLALVRIVVRLGLVLRALREPQASRAGVG